jgi:O-methyltransferase
MADTAALYLDLIERCLLNTIYEDPAQDPWSPQVFDAAKRESGLDWPLQAHTMIGRKRMANLRHIVETVIADHVPGDLIETGVWRGGACIYMRAILKAHDAIGRTVYVADSFQGLPLPDPERYPADTDDQHHSFNVLSVSLDEVRANFAKYGLLDERVVFVKGWFKDTLPALNVDTFAVLRLDGDMYGSTMESLTALYDRLAPGGFIIIDDYGLPGCRQAVTDFREVRAITEPLVEIDTFGSYWRRT